MEYLLDITNSTSANFDLEEYIKPDVLEPSDSENMPDPSCVDLSDLDTFLSSLAPPPPPQLVCRPKANFDPSNMPSPLDLDSIKRGRPRKTRQSEEDPSTSARRERNRQAAQRCRDKRQARLEELEAEIEQLRNEKHAMMAELIRLGARPSI
jgi:hypothetical protein